MFLSLKEVEGNGRHDIGTGWTVFYNQTALEFQAVTIWLAVWVRALTPEVTNTSHSNSGLLQPMLHCNLQSVPQKHSAVTVQPWSGKDVFLFSDVVGLTPISFRVKTDGSRSP